MITRTMLKTVKQQLYIILTMHNADIIVCEFQITPSVEHEVSVELIVRQ